MYAQNFAQNAFTNFPNFSPIMLFQCSCILCLHYAPKLATFVTIIMDILIRECSITVFHYKMTVLLESIEYRSKVL